MNSSADGLLFLTRGINTTDLSVFLNKLYQKARPRALSKIIDLISDLRPTDHNIRERERQFTEMVKKCNFILFYFFFFWKKIQII